jgi:hypothetical protein
VPRYASPDGEFYSARSEEDSTAVDRSLPFKANAERRRHIPKQRHRVTNSAAYDAALRQRGSAAA